MSIYALPGALHELISSGISSKGKRDVSSPCKEKTSDAQEVSLTGSSSTTIDTSANNPLHRRPSSGPMGNESDHSNSSSCSLSGSSDGRNAGNSNVMIAVKEAKIDPARLIRSLSSSSSDAKKKSSSSKNAAYETTGEDSTKLNGQRRRRSKKDDTDDSSRECDPHEDAIKFEINVSFNGREYTATRTLPRILQFRCDLIEEFRARRKWRERRRKRKEAVVPRMAKVMDLSDDEEEEKAIPELPRLADDPAGGHGKGFTMLNALLRPYGSGVERWLLKVLDIVPHDSQCLTQFLWEPLSGSATSKKHERRGSSLSTLGAIQETDSLDYGSDTEDYLLHC